MASVIDALAITIGLDTTQFDKSRQQVTESTKKMKDEVERDAKGMSQSFRSVEESLLAVGKSALALFALFAGAKSIKDFTEQIIGADFSLGRLATSVGATPAVLAAMSNAVARSGGSADAASASFQKLSDAFEEVKTFGTGSIIKPMSFLAAEGHHEIDYYHGMQKALPGIIENLHTIAKERGEVHAIFMGKQAGLDEGTIMLALKGLKAWNAEIEKSKRLGVPQQQWVETTGKLIESYRTLSQAAEDLGRKIIVGLSPYIQNILEKMAAWITANKQWIDQKVENAFRAFGNAITAIANSREMQEFVRWMSSRSTWQPFLDFIKAAGNPSNWQGFREVIGWFRQQLKEIRDIFKTFDILMSPGFRAGVPWEKLSRDWDRNHDSLGRDERAERGLPPLGDPGEGDAPIAGGGGLGLRRGRRRGAGARPRGSGPLPPHGRYRANQSANFSAWVDELRKAGFNDNVIAASAGSVETESSWSPRAHNDQNGGHTGHWQWDSTRWPKIPAWIKARGGDPFDTRWQARAWVAEHDAKPGDSVYDIPRTANAGRIFRSNPTLPQAIHGVRESERFGPGEEGGRAAHARRLLPSVQQAAPPAAKTSWYAPIPRAGEFARTAGAAHVAQAHNMTSHNDNRRSSEVHVGQVTVNSQATDAAGIAKDIKPAIQRYAFQESNYGPA